MEIYDLILTGLCLNITCFEEPLTGCSSAGEGDFPPCGNITAIRQLQQQRRSEELSKLAEDLKQEHLFITTVENGILSSTSYVNGTLVGNGVAFVLLNIIKEKYGFNYTIIKPEDNRWRSEAGTGILKLLTGNKVVLAAAFLPVLADFFNKTTYSPGLDTGKWVALMRRPKESATGSGLLAPFTLPVWLLILLSLVVVGPIIYLLILLKAKLCKDEDNTIYPLPSCIWFVYGALLKQGTTLSPTTDSSRLLFATWWLFITILTAFYTANLTAFLTLSKFTLPINRAEDIGAKQYKWVSNRGNSIRDIIDSENNVPDSTKLQTLGTILGNSDEFPNMTDAEILKRYVEKSNLIFLREKPIVDYVMYEDYKQKTRANVTEVDRCTYVVTKFNITSYPRAFAYAKNFKYQHIFSSAIQHLVESGIIQYKLDEGLPDTEICPLDLKSSERRLRNSDLSMTYIIVGVGFAISAFVFSIEIIYIYFFQKDGKTTLNLSKLGELATKNLPKHFTETGITSNNYFNTENYNYKNNITANNNNIGDFPFVSKFKTPPPPYHTLFAPGGTPNGKKRIINGREYWVTDKNGEQHLIPTRAPSALLFQFTN